MDKKKMTDYKKLIEDYYSAVISEEDLQTLRSAVRENPRSDPEFAILECIFRMEDENMERLITESPADLEMKILDRIRKPAPRRAWSGFRGRFIAITSAASAAVVAALIFGQGLLHDTTGKSEQPEGNNIARVLPAPSSSEVSATRSVNSLTVEERSMIQAREHGLSASAVKDAESSSRSSEERPVAGEDLPPDPEQIAESYALLSECFDLLGEAISEARGEYSESLSELNGEEVIMQL